MDFNYKIETKEDVVEVELKGYLDATNAGELMEAMKQLVGKPIKKIVFHVAELDYIASAGLRVIIFTKQKIGYEADVILDSPQEAVANVVEMTGLDNFVTIV